MTKDYPLMELHKIHSTVIYLHNDGMHLAILLETR